MTQIEIEKLFKEVIANKKFGKVSGLDRQTVYNLRHRKITFGTMLEVLFKMGEIKVINLPLMK